MGDLNLGRNSFRVVGLVTNSAFQKCRCLTQKLAKTYPNDYEAPDIRPMLNVDWVEYLQKIRRKIGGSIFELTKPVAVFFNGEFLGDDENLDKFISRTYKFTIIKNFEAIGIEQLYLLLQKYQDKGREFVYFCIAIDGQMIGSLLFLLYSDLVPKTCKNFIRRCKSKSKHKTYLGTPIHRIAKPSFVQAGGWDLIHKRLACENYTVPHDRRGVLSMANAGHHTLNSTQFHIALNPTPWMDYKYVAFGQLMHGEEVLQQIEQVPTDYESPLKPIQIIKCGKFDISKGLDGNFEIRTKPIRKPKKEVSKEEKLTEKPVVEQAQAQVQEEELAIDEVLDKRDADSFVHEDRFYKGNYCIEEDLQSYDPFFHLPEDVIKSMLEDQEENEYDLDYSREFLLEQLNTLEEKENEKEAVNETIKKSSINELALGITDYQEGIEEEEEGEVNYEFEAEVNEDVEIEPEVNLELEFELEMEHQNN